jgi:t-SNARE complex subunit (syntaxin)
MMVQPYSESNPRYHVIRIRDQLTQLIDHMRDDIGKVDDPKVKALFEVSAEVLSGLRKSYEDYESKTEEVWR